MTFWHMSRAIGRPKPPQTTSPRKSSSTKSKPQSWKPSFSRVSKPWMIPRPPQPRPTSGPPSSIAKTPSRLKHTSPIATDSPASFFFELVSMIVGQALPPNSRLVVSLFGSQPISKTFLPCCAIM